MLEILPTTAMNLEWQRPTTELNFCAGKEEASVFKPKGIFMKSMQNPKQSTRALFSTFISFPRWLTIAHNFVAHKIYALPLNVSP